MDDHEPRPLSDIVAQLITDHILPNVADNDCRVKLVDLLMELSEMAKTQSHRNSP